VGQCAISARIRVNKPLNAQFNHLLGEVDCAHLRLFEPTSGLNHAIFGIDAHDNVLSSDVLDSFLHFVWSFDRGGSDDDSIDPHVDKPSSFGCVTYSATELNWNIDSFDDGRHGIGVPTNAVTSAIKINYVHFASTLINPAFCYGCRVVIEHGLTFVVALSQANAVSIS
jgi:hypothetical protein